MENETLSKKNSIKMIVLMLSAVIFGFSFVFGSIAYLCGHVFVGTILGAGIAIIVIGFFGLMSIFNLS